MAMQSFHSESDGSQAQGDLNRTPSPFEAELEALIREHEDALEKSEHDNASGIPYWRVMQMQTRCLAAIERAAGCNSEYYKKARNILAIRAYPYQHLSGLIGVADALLHNIQSGYLKSLEELIHGTLFGDFLEMAQHLLDKDYKDAAAVIAGSALEAHLRQLCEKTRIPAEEKNGKPKKAEKINSELSKAKAYSKLDQKNITAWFDLRNKAAHGDYGEYNKEQIALLIAGIRDFITRVPA